MRHYEVVTIIHPDQYERVGLMAERYKKIIADSGGTIHRFENWGLRNLAYAIQNQKRAYYLLMNIECDNQALKDLEESFRFSNAVIRSLVIRRKTAISEDSSIRRQAIASAEISIYQTAASEAAASEAAASVGQEETTPEVPTKASAETPAKTPAKTPAETPAETPAKTPEEKKE